MKIIVEVSGGVVQDVHRFGSDFSWDGVWYVLDWDDVKADALETWDKMDYELQNFVQEQYPEEYKRWFSFDGGGDGITRNSTR